MLSSKIKLIYVFYRQSCALNQFKDNINNNICWHGLHVIGVLVAKPYWWHKPSCKGLLLQILIFYKDLLQAKLDFNFHAASTEFPFLSPSNPDISLIQTHHNHRLNKPHTAFHLITALQSSPRVYVIFICLIWVVSNQFVTFIIIIFI